MFEKEAEERSRRKISNFIPQQWGVSLIRTERTYETVEGAPHFYLRSLAKMWKEGAEYGYNKANEWHWIKDGDFPEEEKEYLIYTKKKKLEIRKIHISGDGKNYLTDVFLMRDLESVIAWKEIVPPELEESEL